MTPTIANTLNFLDKDALRHVAGRSGPFISATVPDHHPGAPEGSRQAVIQSHWKAAAERLNTGPFSDRASELLPPIEELGRDPALAAGGTGLAIFRSPEATLVYRAPGHAPRLVIASHPHITPFIANASTANDFFILGLGTKHLRLLHYSHGNCTEMPLPKEVPPNLEEAGQYNRSDPNLENRSSIGSSTGNMHAVRFGTTSDREAASVYLHHFYSMVDRGLKATLAGKRLLLMGVNEEIQAYRRAAKYEHLFATEVTGGPEYLSAAEVAGRARDAARTEYQLEAEAVLSEFRDMKERIRTLKDVPAILRAAAQGRVHRLCIRKDTEFRGAAESEAADQDLLNAAVVETLRSGGQVFEVPQDRLPASEPAAAILRY